MATVRKRGDKYQVQVRRLGNPSVTKTFHALKDAQAWARHMEVQADRRDLPYDLTWQAYWEAWNSQRKFSSAWGIVRRYHENMPEKLPERVHDLLLEVEDILEAPVTGDKSKFEEIRQKLWTLRQEVEQQVPRPAEWFPKWKG
jgi:hypothetical protein